MFPLVFFVIRLKVGKGIGLSSNSQLGIINMRIYLRRVQVIMPQRSWSVRTSTPFCSISVAAVWRSL